MTTFRAAYWTDGQSDVLLTDETQSDLTDAELLDAARQVAEMTGLEIGSGRIVIGDYTTRSL